MITLKITKDKIISMMKITQRLIDHVQGLKGKLNYNMTRAELGAHLWILTELSTKLSMKYLQLANKPGDRPVQFSLNEMQALVLLHYRMVQPVSMEDGYEVATLQEISDPMFQHLLN